MIRRLIIFVALTPFFSASRAEALSVTSGPTAIAVYFTSATLTWTTDTPSDSLLAIGINNGSGQVAGN